MADPKRKLWIGPIANTTAPKYRTPRNLVSTRSATDERCVVCGISFSGADYVWRMWFPLMADAIVEFAHPACAEAEAIDAR